MANLIWWLDKMNHTSGLNWKRLCDLNERLITRGYEWWSD